MLVNLDNIRQNLDCLRLRAGVKLLFMVKADAYGHGLVKVAQAVESRVDFFGVATVEEGVKLRRNGITKPVLVTVFSKNEARIAVKYGLSAAVSNAEQLQSLEKAAKDMMITDTPLKAKIHIKTDTGMNRLGIKNSDELQSFVNAAKNCAHVEVEGCYSHLYNANREQYSRFAEYAEIVRQAFPKAILHISSSGAVEKFGADSLDMVRVGIAGYGYGGAHLKPAMTVKSQIVASKKVCRGEHIGYGGYTAEKNMNIAVVFGGYADGVIRREGGCVVVRNTLCKILNVPCMDMTIIDTQDFLAEAGETAEFVSLDYNAEQLAEAKDTISYEMLTGFSRDRCKRIYLN